MVHNEKNAGVPQWHPHHSHMGKKSWGMEVLDAHPMRERSIHPAIKHYSSSAANVSRPATPSAINLRAPWNARTALSVPLPKIPSKPLVL